MYRPNELALFTLSEFARGLEGLTDEEARTRMRKADGSEMNAITWIVSHIVGHWLIVASYAKDGELPWHLVRFVGEAADPTPPLLDEALKLLRDATASIDWLTDADETLFSTTREEHLLSKQGQDNIGTVLINAVLHTWFHTGEINAVRQMLGHAEIPFVGDMLGRLEWRGGGGVDTGYRPDELARFAISEFARGLEGLTDEEARTRIGKADGSEMNAITWIVSHIAGHWLNRPEQLQRFAPGSGDPTPPPLDEMQAALDEAKTVTERWLPSADDSLLSSKPNNLGGESIGTGAMRAVLHTWFHTGEINAVRQMLGHVEIPFVGRMLGNLEWRGAPA